MRQLTRLIRYVAPYWWPVGASVLLMAAVGLLDAFRLLLIGPIFDRVLNPGSQISRDATVYDSGQRACHLPAAVCSLTLSESMDGRGVCSGGGYRVEGDLRLCGHVPGELRRVRNDHGSAQ